MSGPYAQNLNKVVEVLERHFIRGYGDTQKPDVEIELLPKSGEKVADLVDGFETPYGLELLASVHWLEAHDGEALDSDSAVSAMAAWNDRKRRLFKPDHIRVA